MNRSEFQIVEMPGRVLAFGEANEVRFPKKSLLWIAFDAIRSAINKTYEMAKLQDHRTIRLSTDARQIARDALLEMLETIHQTSRGVAIGG